MQLVTVDGQFKPKEAVTGYESLFWKDSCVQPGEFKLKTFDIQPTMDKLPLKSYITLMDNGREAIMLVEKYSVKTDSEGRSYLEVSGRSGETYLEARPALKDYSKGIDEVSYSYRNYRPYNLMLRIMYDCIIRPTRYSFSQDYNFTPISYDGPKGDVIDEYHVPRASIYSCVREIAEANGFSFRMVNSIAKEDSAVTDALYDFRPGRDRRGSGEPMFSADQGDFLSESYDESIVDQADTVYAFSKLAMSGYGSSTYKGNYTHRFRFVDVPDSEPKDLIREDDLTIKDSINQTFYVDEYNQNISLLVRSLNTLSIRDYQKRTTVEKAKEMYKVSQKTASYSFEVSPYSKKAFIKDYYIGDIIKVQPSWGSPTDMRIESYVRNEDASGEIGYPELTPLLSWMVYE